MYLLLLIGIAAFFAGCGGITVQQPKNQDCNENGCGTSTAQGTAVQTGGETAAPTTPAPPPVQQGNKPSQDTTTAAVDVDVHVHVAASAGASSGEASAPAADLTGFRYDPAQRAWQAAKDAAPTGMRLATRAEAMALLDAGALAPYKHGDVWTATEREPGIAFLLDLDNGQTPAEGETIPLGALYVKGGIP